MSDMKEKYSRRVVMGTLAGVFGILCTVSVFVFYSDHSLSHSDALRQIDRSEMVSAYPNARYVEWKYVNGFPEGNDEYIVIATATYKKLSCEEQKKYMKENSQLFPEEFIDFGKAFESKECDSVHSAWYKHGLIGVMSGDKAVELVDISPENTSTPVQRQCIFRKSEQGWIIQGCRILV